MLEVDEARALITTSLTDDDLAAVIAREEAWLARKVGPLEGERTERFLTPDGDEVLRLHRPTSEADLEDGSGLRSDYEVNGWSDVVLTANAPSWRDDVVVTYTPTDADEVKRVLATCVRLTIGESAYQSQSAGDYSATVSLADQRQQRYAAWRSLLRPATPGTLRVQSTIPFGGKSLGSVGVVSVGS